MKSVCILITVLLTGISVSACTLDLLIVNLKYGKEIDSDCFKSLLHDLESENELNDFFSDLLKGVERLDIASESKKTYYKSIQKLVFDYPDSPLGTKSEVLHALAVNLVNEVFSPDLAILCYQEEIKLIKFKEGKDSPSVGGILANIAHSHYKAGDSDSAGYYAESVLENYPVSEKQYADIYYLLGQIYVQKGNRVLAERNYNLAAQYGILSGYDSMYVVDYCLNPIGILYNNLRQYEKAASVFQQSLDILIRNDDGSEDYKVSVLGARTNIAIMYHRLDSLDRMGSIFQDLVLNYAEIEKFSSVARTWMNWANILLENNQPAPAYRKYQLADSILNIHPDENLSRILTGNWAHYYRVVGDYQNAIDFKLNEMDLVDPGVTEGLYRTEALKVKEEHIGSIYQRICDLSVIYRDRFRNLSSDEKTMDTVQILYESAAGLLDQFKANLINPEFSIDLGALSNDLLKEVLELASDSIIEPEWYYSFFEKAKSSSLLASIQQVRAESVLMEDLPVMKQIHTLESDISEIEIQREQTTNSDSMRIYYDRLLVEKSEQLIELNRLKLESIRSADIIGSYYARESLFDLRRDLEDSTAILSYFLDLPAIYILSIDRSKVELHKRNYPGELGADIGVLTSYSAIDADNPSTWIAVNNRVSETLIRDLNLEHYKNLIVIPDGILSYLPFELLSIESISGSLPFSDMPFLIKSNIISYNFSASIRSEMTKNRARGRGLLTMAPRFTLSDGISNPGNVPLIHAQREVETIRSIWKGVKQYKPQSKSGFVNSISMASMVHFAGHATLNDDKPDKSYMAFSSSPSDDGKLYIRDIYRMNTPCDLIVLSACNTGKGQLKDGEGAMSLARAFAYSGSKSLLYSLWEVDDASTRRIMQHFYSGLKNGMDKDESLREAKLNYLMEAKGRAAHPYFWAGFIMMGDVSPIEMGIRPYLTYLLVGIAVMALALALLYFKNRP